MAGDYNLDDLQRRLDQFEKMGIKDLLGRTPGPSETISDQEDPALALSRIRKMINAMTDEERKDPDIIDASRRSLIAKSSGTQLQEVESFLAQFRQLRVLMRKQADTG